MEQGYAQIKKLEAATMGDMLTTLAWRAATDMDSTEFKHVRNLIIAAATLIVIWSF